MSGMNSIDDRYISCFHCTAFELLFRVVASLRVSCDQLGETLREAPTQLHHCGKRGSDKLEKINERALRFVTRDKSTTY